MNCPKTTSIETEEAKEIPEECATKSVGPPNPSRGRVNHEVQTVNWEAGKEGAAETAVKRGLKKAHKSWIRGKKSAQTMSWGGAEPRSANRELGIFQAPKFQCFGSQCALHGLCALDPLLFSRICQFGPLSWESLALLSFGPFGPKVANRVRKWVPGPSRPRGPKSAKRSRKRVKIDYFSTILTLFRLGFGLFGPQGRKGPGTHFRTLFATFGPKGPNDPCSGQKFSQPLSKNKGIGIWVCISTLKTLTSLNKEVRPFFLAIIAFGVFPLFLPLAITAFGGPESYSNLAIIAFGEFELIVPKYYYRLGKMESRSLASLIKEVTVFKEACGSGITKPWWPCIAPRHHLNLPFQLSQGVSGFGEGLARGWNFLGENQKGTAGRGREKKRHDNLRQTSRQFTAFYDNISEKSLPNAGRMVRGRVSTCRLLIKGWRQSSWNNLAEQPPGLGPFSTEPSTIECRSLSDKASHSLLQNGPLAPSYGVRFHARCSEQLGKHMRNVPLESARPT